MCLKELRETWVWLEILRRLDTGPTEARELVITGVRGIGGDRGDAHPHRAPER
jgi:hypothetical protein